MRRKFAYSVIAAFLIMGGCSMAMAQNQTPIGIDEQIQQIESAPPSERYQLMNRFKMQLATMNQQERMHAIEALRSRLQGNLKKMGQQPMKNLPDHVDFHQHNQMMQQGINEQMGQKQGMQEYMHEHPGFHFGTKGEQKGTSMTNPSQPFQNPGNGIEQGTGHENENNHPQIPNMGSTTAPTTGSGSGSMMQGGSLGSQTTPSEPSMSSHESLGTPQQETQGAHITSSTQEQNGRSVAFVRPQNDMNFDRR